MPDVQVRSQEELHYRMTRQPETYYLGGYGQVEGNWPSVSSSVLRKSLRRPLRTYNWSPQKTWGYKLVGKCYSNFYRKFSYGISRCLRFSDIRFRLSKKNYHQDFNAFGWSPFNDWAAGIVEVGYKTGPMSQSQIDGVRLSETKGAHKS